MEITTIGLDLAKSVFQVHAVDAARARWWCGKALRRAQVLPFFAKLAPCLSAWRPAPRAIYWARELDRARPRGAADAAGLREALCEAGQDRRRRCRGDLRGGHPPDHALRPDQVAEQQAALALHRTRDLLVRQRTQLVNMIRGLLAEFGIDIPRASPTPWLVPTRCRGEAHEVPAFRRAGDGALAEQVDGAPEPDPSAREGAPRLVPSNELVAALATIPGVGSSRRRAFAATVTDPTVPLGPAVRRLARA